MGGGSPQPWFMWWGRWAHKATALWYANDFRNPRVLGELVLPVTKTSGSSEGRGGGSSSKHKQRRQQQQQ